MKVVNETKKILHLPEETPISCTAARVPVFNGHSEAVDVEFQTKVEPNEIREILKMLYGIKVIDNRTTLNILQHVMQAELILYL